MFEPFSFSENQIKRYYQTACRDLNIALNNSDNQVKFIFCYDALLKLAITVCAFNHSRIKARTGHHIELIEKLSEFLNNGDIKVIGDRMRMKRNRDLYDGGSVITEKESDEYSVWLKTIFKTATVYLKAGQSNLLL
jgi:hypothetical protein